MDWIDRVVIVVQWIANVVAGPLFILVGVTATALIASGCVDAEVARQLDRQGLLGALHTMPAALIASGILALYQPPVGR